MKKKTDRSDPPDIVATLHGLILRQRESVNSLRRVNAYLLASGEFSAEATETIMAHLTAVVLDCEGSCQDINDLIRRIMKEAHDA